jgi:signal transduction histidine kinase
VCRWLLFAVLALLALAGPASHAATLELTPAEREWIGQHGPVRAVAVRGAEPFYTSAEGQQPQGFAIDLLAIAAERAGLKLQYRTVDSIPEAVALFTRGEADLSPISAWSEVRSRFVSYPGSLLTAQLVLVARRDTGDLSSEQNFAGRTIAVVAASVPGNLVAARFPNARFESFRNNTEMVVAVSQGRADIGVAWQHDAVYAIEANLLGNLRVHRMHSIAGSYYGPVVSLRQPVLHGILVKALASLTPGERAAAARRWLPAGVDTLWAPDSVALTPAERDWVQRAGELRVGYDAAFAPYAFSDRLGGFDGLGAEMLRMAAAKTGLRIVRQAGASFADVYQQALAGDLNLIVGMARTAERREAFEFIGPFASAPTALVMRSDDDRVWRDPGDIVGGRLGLLKSHFLAPQLRSRRPGLPLVEFDSNEAVLQALADGRVDAAIGNGVVLGRLIEERFIGSLRVTGVVPGGDSELFFAVPKDQPELARVLQKGFEALTPGETTALQRRWLLVSVRPGIRAIDLLRWGLPAGLGLAAVVLTLVLANRRLRRANAEAGRARAAAEEANVARGRFLAYLSHELRGTIGGIGSGMQMLQAADDPLLRQRLAQTSQTACTGLLDLLETTLSHERTMMTGVTLHMAVFDLQDWWARGIAPLALAAAGKGLAFEATGPAAPVRVCADSARLGQVLGNLAGNAIKFTPAGRVRATARWDEAAQRLHLTVEDSGPGIAEADRERLFEPYAQGDAGRQAGAGAGLGLAITRQIVQAMGGRITPGEAAGGGALFNVEIPLERA